MWMRNQLGPLAHHLPNLPTGVGKFDVLEFIEFFNSPAQKPQNRVGKLGSA